MERNLKGMGRTTYDLLVIGGGINGVATAWDAALRGLRVALVERDDFGAATSSATLKLVHGGLRYLQHLDFRRMRESIRERSTLLRIAPHLVEPLPFLVPTRGFGLQGRLAMSAAILMNDMVSADRNRGIGDPDRRLPHGHILMSRNACRQRVPEHDWDRQSGGVLFYDAQMYNSERLTLAFALSAAAAGADLANYARADAFLQHGGRVRGARVTDTLSGETVEIRADVTVNVTGPWSDITLGLLRQPDPPRHVRRSKGIQLVTRRLTGATGLAVSSRYKDPDAVVDVGGRRFFITPWRGRSLVGTTDTVFEGDPDDFRITESDIRAFIDEINEAFPAAALARDDVYFAMGGLRPITEKNIDSGASTARKYEISDSARDGGPAGLVTVVGVKYTTCRFLAEQVVDRVFRHLNRTPPPATTAHTPLAGGDISRMRAFTDEAVREAGNAADATVVTHLVRNYGTQYERILALMAADEALAVTVAGSAEVPRAEIVHAVREESARRLTDVVLRRTDLGTLGHPGGVALADCADLMAAELAWDPARRGAEIASVERLYDFSDR